MCRNKEGLSFCKLGCCRSSLALRQVRQRGVLGGRMHIF